MEQKHIHPAGADSYEINIYGIPGQCCTPDIRGDPPFSKNIPAKKEKKYWLLLIPILPLIYLIHVYYYL